MNLEFDHLDFYKTCKSGFKLAALIALLAEAAGSTTAFGLAHQPEILKCQMADDAAKKIIRFADGREAPQYFGETRAVDAACVPDTFYSWVEPEFIAQLQNQKRESSVGPKRQIYTWRTPLGSFGYGDYAIRLKIKSNTKFKFIYGDDACGENAINKFRMSQSEIKKQAVAFKRLDNNVADKGFFKNTLFDNTVFIRGAPNFIEYDFCSLGPIESWSFGQPQHLKEMQDEWNWDTKNFRFDLSSYLAGGTYQLFYADHTFAEGIDEKDFSRSKLEKNIQKMRDLVKSNMGKIYFNQGINPSTGLATFKEGLVNSQEGRRHFMTAKPIFFFFEHKK